MNRLKIIVILAFVMGVMIYGRLFFLQIVMGNYYSGLADGNRLKEDVIVAERGKIFDSGGKILAEGIDKDGRRVRYYEPGELVGSVVGFLREGKGVVGIEAEYESILAGQDGKELWELNALGEKIRRLARKEAVPGRDIKLNLDLDLQKRAYFVLSNKIVETGFGGSVIVSKISGEILSLVSLPSYDPNLFINGGKRGVVGGNYVSVEKAIEDEKNKPMFNRVIAGQYPPGSVYKPLVALAGLEKKVIDKNTEFEDIGEIKIGEGRFGNWYFDKYGKTEGAINLIRALARSNDIYFYRLGEKLGIETIVKYSTLFGVGEVTGIDLDGESKGLMPSPLWRERRIGERWFLGNTYHLSIGQGDLLMSPLQVNRMTASIMSGKKCMSRLIDNSKLSMDNCVDLDIHDENRKIVMEGMRGACMKGGTAFVFFDLDGRVLCKTGTAQHGGEETKPHAWINVVIPEVMENNELNIDNVGEWVVVTVMLEEAGEGSEEAGPVAREVVNHLLER